MELAILLETRALELKLMFIGHGANEKDSSLQKTKVPFPCLQCEGVTSNSHFGPSIFALVAGIQDFLVVCER